MKQLILALAVLATIAAKADGTAFFTNVTNLWYQGHKSNVLAIAEERLARNTNDIAGLILKMEYDLEFLDLVAVSNSCLRTIACGKEIQSPCYSARYPEFKTDMEDILDIIAHYPSDQLSSDRGKAHLPGKKLFFEDDLLAVCLDGLVTNYPSITP